MDLMVPVWNVDAMTQQFDFIVIGAGIAGASVAAHLAEHATVAILEMEDRPGYHTTGRSAAAYEPNYGPKPILAFARASGAFFNTPPSGFADAPLLIKRASLMLEPDSQSENAAKFLSDATSVEEISTREIKKLWPVYRDGYAKRGFIDHSTGDLDVDLLHRGYLKLFKARGGKLFVSSPAQKIAKNANAWAINTPLGEFSASNLVNASGAWGDEVAKLAGIKAVGLIPKRRSIGVIPIEGHPDFMAWPFVVDAAETWYCKPQSGKMIVSSADETPVQPHDAFADDMAIAEGIERLMEATTIEVTRLEHSWGGLRTFAPDGSPVIGFDPHADGFFWLVGQGGYGILSAPALSRVAAAMAMRKPLPEDVLAAGLNLTDIIPDRFQ